MSSSMYRLIPLLIRLGVLRIASGNDVGPVGLSLKNKSNSPIAIPGGPKTKSNPFFHKGLSDSLINSSIFAESNCFSSTDSSFCLERLVIAVINPRNPPRIVA